MKVKSINGEACEGEKQLNGLRKIRREGGQFKHETNNPTFKEV